VPGNIGSKLSKGTNKLIKEGAKLVESVDDVLNEIEELRRLKEKEIKDSSAFLPELSNEERLIYSELKNEPLHIDEITKLTGIASSKALTILLSLELSGLVNQLPGKMFQLRRPI
jgi:DNA processing protein